MKKHIACDGISVAVVFSFSVLMPTWGDVVVGYGETATRNVAQGTTLTESERLVVREGVVEKTGEGEWTLPESAHTGYATVPVRIRQGSVSFSPGGAEVSVPTPTATLNKARMWLDVSAGTPKMTVVNSNSTDYVDRWYDCRETDPSSPTYMYAESVRDVEYSSGNSRWLYDTFSPELKSFLGKDGLYFGGVGGNSYNGRCMFWRNPDGKLFPSAPANGQVRHLFVVHGIENSHGVLVGTVEGETTVGGGTDTSFLCPPSYGKGWRKNPAYIVESAERIAAQGRFYLNGQRCDPRTTSSVDGWQLVEFHSEYVPFSANTFFNEHNFSGKDCPFWNNDRTGGDYLAEVLVFTNALTEVERMRISEYLMNKWVGAPTVQPMALSMSDTASVMIDVPENTTDVDLGVVPETGVLAKSGTGDLAFVSKETSLSGCAVDLRQGSLTLTHAMPLVPKAGTEIAAAKVNDGNSVTVVPAAAGTLRKTGDGDVAVSGLPAEVEQLEVAAGQLVIRDSVSSDVLADDDVVVDIPNGNFETGAHMDAGDGAADFQNVGDTLSSQWTLTKKSSDDSNGFLFRPTRGGRTNWALPPETPEGLGCLCLKRDAAYKSAQFTIPVAGRYELSFWIAGRRGYLGQQVDIFLVDSTGAKTNRTMCTAMLDPVFFHRQIRHFEDVEPGTYELHLRSMSTFDSLTAFDDFRMRRCGTRENAGTYAIPGGDFEDVVLTAKTSEGSISEFHAETSPSGWSFGHASGGPSARCATALYSKGTYANMSRQPVGQGVFVLAFPTNGATASVTFTPPAGEWMLSAALDYRKDIAGKIAASVAIGGAVTSLGSVSAMSHLMERVSWPTAFAVDGATPVTLTLTSQHAANIAPVMIADDFKLIPASTASEELVTNGGFNSSSGWTFYNATENSARTAESYNYTAIPGHFGHAVFEGSARLKLTGDSRAEQQITFPTAGRYRLSLYASHRCELDYPTWGHYGDNPVSVYTVDGGSVTNEILRFTPSHTNYVQYVADFMVETAGPKTLVLAGLDPADKSSLIDGLSVKAVAEARTPPDFNRDLKITVAEGAKLSLQFEGTKRIKRLSLGGHRIPNRGGYSVTSDMYPDYLTGFGVLELAPSDGTMLIMK